MKNLTRAEAAGFLLSHDNYLILTHGRPDGDTVGSAAALCRGLRNLGKTAWILENPEFTQRFDFLLEGLTKEAHEQNDTVISVDVAEVHLLPRAFVPLANLCQLKIDHHRSGSGYAPEELVDPTSASCAEIISDLLAILDIQLDAPTATAIYTGTATDTGCFRYANTTTHSFLTAAICTQAGADIQQVNQVFFETNSLSKLRLQAWIVEHLKFFDGGKLAIVAIPRAVEDLLGVTEADTDNLASYPRTVAGVRMAATLRQSKDGVTRISVRALPGYDAAAVCARFGGGGHKGAAGASTGLPLDEAAKAVEEIMLTV